MRLNEIQNSSDEELFGATRLVREIARFLWQENIPSGKCIYPDRIENYIQPNPRLSRLWAAQSSATQEFMADQIFAAMYQMEMDSFMESQDNSDDDLFGASFATATKVQSILAAGIPLYITNIVSNDKDRQGRVKQLDYRIATFGQQKPYISFWFDDAQTNGSIIPWSDSDWQLQRTQDSFVLWPRSKKLQETHSDDDAFAERSVSQKIMHLVQTGQPIYYVANSEGPRDQWRLREIIRATPKGYTWLNHSGITISYDYESFPVRLEKSKDGKIIAVPTRIHDVTGLIDESDTSDDELFGPRAVTRHSLQQMMDNNVPVYLKIKSNNEDARITEINPPMEGYPGYWMRYQSPTQRGMIAWRDRHWAVEPYRDGMILQQLPGTKMYESDSDDDDDEMFATGNRTKILAMLTGIERNFKNRLMLNPRQADEIQETLEEIAEVKALLQRNLDAGLSKLYELGQERTWAEDLWEQIYDLGIDWQPPWLREDEDDEELFGQDNLKDRLNARLNNAWKKIVDTLDELGPEVIFQNAKMFNKLYDKWDDGEHDPMEVMAYREPADKVLQAVAELEKIARDPYDYLEHLHESTESDEELFGNFGTSGQRIIYQYGQEMLKRLQQAWRRNPAVKDEYNKLFEVGNEDGIFDLVLKLTGATANKAFVVDAIIRVYCYEGLNAFGWMLENSGNLKELKQALTSFVNDPDMAQDDWFLRELSNFMPGQPGWVAENADDDMFSRPGEFAKNIKTQLTTLNDPYVRTVEIVKDLARQKFKVTTTVSYKSPQSPRRRATFFFGNHYEKNQAVGPKIKAELDAMGFESQFTGSHWLSVKVPPVFSNILDEDSPDDELFGSRKLTPGYLKELVDTTGLRLEIGGGEQFSVVSVGRVREFPNEIGFRLLTSYGEEFTVSYPPDMLRLDLSGQGYPVLHYGTLTEEDDDMFSTQSKLQTDSLRQIFRAVEDLVTLTIVNVYPEDPRDDTLNELNKFMTRHKVPFNIIELALQKIASFDSFEDFYNEMLHIYSQHYKDELGEVKEPESDEELFTPEKTLMVRSRDVANVLNKINFTTMSNVMNIKQEYMPQIREKIYSAILAYERGDVLEGNAQIYALSPRAFDYVKHALHGAGLTSYARRIAEQRNKHK